jgi:hypothetical protein
MAPDLYQAVEPRRDVLEGTLSDAVFAASLDEVVAGTAPYAYGVPSTFFAATYPSAGLRSLLAEALGRLSGKRPDAAPVIRVETNLGGGKTHNLIALYHAARGELDPMRALEFTDPSLLPDDPVDQLGVFVGTAVGATSFPGSHGIVPNTPWGHLALEIGGAEGYELLRSDDEALTAPGSHALSELIGDRPTLVLIDEIARYLAVARGREVGQTTLDVQTTAFLMALLEAVATSPKAVVVLTTTEVTDAFGEETERVLKAVSDAMSLIARKEHVLRPADEADLPAILARRLFARVDEGAAAAVGDAYREAAAEASVRGAELPERMSSGGFGADVTRSYPFHPELITILDKRLSTIPNFQRTRGALRLLARTVRTLFDYQPPGALLIHPHNVDLADSAIAEDLSSRLDQARLEPVIRADIASRPGSEPSHAEQVDARLACPFAKRLATTAYLYSLTRDVPGVSAPVLVGSVLAPGDDPNVIVKALDSLEASAWYLHVDARGYRFSVEPSLQKLVQEAEAQVTTTDAKREATRILSDAFRESALKVRRVWEDASIPDRFDDAWLAVLHWDEFGDDHGVVTTAEVPAQVVDLFEKTATGGVREFRNRIVFLAPAARSHESMLGAVRRLLGLRRLADSRDLLSALPEEKRADVQRRVKEAELEARIAVCNHVNLCYVPSQGGLEVVELDLVTTASAKRNQTEAVLDRLAAMEKTLVAGDRALDPGFIRSKLGSQLDNGLSTSELVRVFARRTDMKLVLDRAQLQSLVTAGVRNGVWEYFEPDGASGRWATKDQPAATTRIADDTFLHPPGSAPAPATGTSSGTGTGAAPLLPSPEQIRAGRARAEDVGAAFSATGKGDVALREARQAARDAGRAQMRGLLVSIDPLGSDAGVELARLLTVVPASAPKASVRYFVRLNTDLGDPAALLSVQFSGTAGQYQAIRSALDQVLRSSEAALGSTTS